MNAGEEGVTVAKHQHSEPEVKTGKLNSGYV